MPKRFDCEEEPNEFMEAPCRCDCGNWFDLEDGHRSERKQNRIICRECKDEEQGFHYGDEVRFTDEYIVNGRTRAHYGDKGKIVAQGNLSMNKTSVKLEGKKYALSDVPVSLLEKLY